MDNFTTEQKILLMSKLHGDVPLSLFKEAYIENLHLNSKKIETKAAVYQIESLLLARYEELQSKEDKDQIEQENLDALGFLLKLRN